MLISVFVEQMHEPDESYVAAMAYARPAPATTAAEARVRPHG